MIKLQLKRLQSLVEVLIFNAKWILSVFYFGLIALLCVFAFNTVREILETLRHPGTLTVEILMEFLDKAMIANLVRTVITGSWHSFVNKNHGVPNENISGGMLKVKLSTSLVMIAAVHMLRIFLESHNIREQIMLIVLFIAASLSMVFVEYMHMKIEKLEHKTHTKEKESKHEVESH